MSDEVLSFEEAIEKYDPVLGFEVHVELNTNTKMFDSAPNEFGDEPNTNVTPVSLGLPGALPTLHFEGKRLDSGVEDSLYGAPRFTFRPQSLTAVPYGLWCNREPGEMIVWLKAAL